MPENPEKDSHATPTQSISGFSWGNKLVGRDDESNSSIKISITLLLLLVIGGGYLAFRLTKDGLSLQRDDTPTKQQEIAPTTSPSQKN